MFVSVDLDAAPPIVRLMDPDDFSSFKVTVRGAGTPRDLASALEPLGCIENTSTAWLEIDALRRLAEARSLAVEWGARFGEMVEKAGPHGWVGDEGRSLRAHCEWTDQPRSPGEKER